MELEVKANDGADRREFERLLVLNNTDVVIAAVGNKDDAQFLALAAKHFRETLNAEILRKEHGEMLKLVTNLAKMYRLEVRPSDAGEAADATADPDDDLKLLVIQAKRFLAMRGR